MGLSGFNKKGVFLNKNMKGFKYRYYKKYPILLTCEHGSKKIPKRYGLLGLKKIDFQSSKDIYDPGSIELVKRLVEKKKVSWISAGYSRLFIDANRQLNKNEKFYASPLKREIITVKNEKEFFIKVPLNIKNFEKEKEIRFKKYVTPYQNKLKELIFKIENKHSQVIILSIHSFYPFYNGEKRDVDIDFIVLEKDKKIDFLFKKIKKEAPYLKIVKNKPWGIKDVFDAGGGSIPLNFYKKNNLKIIYLDINNIHLNNNEKIEKMAELIKKVFFN